MMLAKVKWKENGHGKINGWLKKKSKIWNSSSWCPRKILTFSKSSNHTM